jgi:hypothetical protein
MRGLYNQAGNFPHLLLQVDILPPGLRELAAATAAESSSFSHRSNSCFTVRRLRNASATLIRACSRATAKFQQLRAAVERL